MMPNYQSLPKNRIIIKDELQDSTIWDLIKPRNTDIVICSCYKSGTTLTQPYLPEYLNENLPEDFADFWDNWVEIKEDKVEYWYYWKHIKSWWQVRNLPNVLLVHYHNLIYDKSQEIDRISEFLNLNINPSKKEMILEKSSLEYMKLNWQKFQPVGVFQPNTFINKGVNGRWQNLLTTEQLKRYDIIISEELEPECAKWVKNAGFLPEVNSTAFD